jgi:murein DD-endopeptidase MepM/ murein hydrolase activator NlpD
MPDSKFRYNLKTLRFEKAGFPWRAILFNSIILAFTCCLFFIGLLYLQNRFVETPLERSLRKENAALLKHKAIIGQELDQSNVLLASLTLDDRALHKRILLTDAPAIRTSEPYSKQILAADFPDFYQLLNKLSQKTSSSFQKAAFTSYHFSQLYWPVRKDLDDLKGYPTLSPVADFKIDQVACGFGNQINPFNKLLYEHNGIDLKGEKGTEILATGSGKVMIALMSELPTGFGNYVAIDHGNGYVTRYAHLQQLKVYTGQKIIQGQVIGMMGMSGGAVAPHLHYEVIKNDTYCNPASYMIGHAGINSYMDLATISKSTKQALD